MPCIHDNMTQQDKILELMNNYERAVFLKGDEVYPRESTRYFWARDNLLGSKVLEIGCSNGYGRQFLPMNIDYTGLDYDAIIVDVANQQEWGNAEFQWADINKYPLGQYDTIIAFEVIEHLHNGLEIVEKLKKRCNRLLISVPHNEPVGFWGEHHVLHNLDESHLPGFTYKFIDADGNLLNEPNPTTINLMMCKYEA